MSKLGRDWAKYGAIAGIIAIPLTVGTAIYIDHLQCFLGAKDCPSGVEIPTGPFLPPLNLPPVRTPVRYTVDSEGAPDGVHEFVHSLLEGGKRINAVSFRPGGGWVVVWNGTQYRSHGLTPELRSTLDRLARAESHISDVIFAPWSGTDTWAIIHGTGEVVSSGAPPGAATAIERARHAGTPITSVAFLDMGAWFVVNRHQVESGGPVPQRLRQEVASALQNKIPRTLRLLGPEGYLMQYEDSSWTASGLPMGAAEEFGRLRNLGKRVHVAAFAPDGGWLIIAEAG